MHGLLAACRRLGSPHVAVVDVGLEVTLRQVGALASCYNAAHVEGTTLALFNALNRVCAVIEGQAEETQTKSNSSVISFDKIAFDLINLFLDRGNSQHSQRICKLHTACSWLKPQDLFS